MKIVKLAIISLIIFVVLALVISLLLPSKINISRSIDIYASKTAVYKNINEIEQWKFWVPNNDSTPVSVVNNLEKKMFVMGDTKAWIAKTSAEKVVADWQVNKGPIVSSEFTLIEHQNTTYITLQWNFIQKVKWYPWEKFALIAAEKGFGDFMQLCLESLKRHTETITPEELKSQ